ncbi:restriction endonuclease subunit S [Citrobacter werkmanii]|uniref:restriction endonuclease subunit S n=1 Tax=Citrobacter werkmanii TaxID=67827 RepID=UPI000EF1F524|nr:restriction endonuclease subunit S [Citrobacter werkmanii]AYL68897.1 hypothetical protein CUC50_24090 [Citrobacter werkmanii]
MSNKKGNSDNLSYVQLGQLADITMGQSPDSSSYNTNQNGLPFLQGCAEFGRLSPIAKVYCNLPLRISRPESILISVRAPVGTQNWGDDSYCIGRGLSAIKARQGIADTKFLSYAILNNIGYLHRRSQGSTFLAITGSDLRSLPVPKFNYRTQHKISLILQSIDKVIDKTETLIQKYYNIRNGLMHDLLTRGIDDNGKLRPVRELQPSLYKETHIGWIPANWSVKKIGEVFNIQLGKMLSRASKSGVNEFPYLGNKNVQWGKIEVGNLQTMNFNPLERDKFKLLPGDILVCEGGDVGRSAIWNNEIDECFYQKALHRLRTINNEVLPEYMLRFMLYAKNNGFFNNYTSQTSIAHLTQEKLSEIYVFYPKAVEQAMLVERFDAIDKKIEGELSVLEILKKKRNGLMYDLLTGKVPVESKATEATHV